MKKKDGIQYQQACAALNDAAEGLRIAKVHFRALRDAAPSQNLAALYRHITEELDRSDANLQAARRRLCLR